MGPEGAAAIAALTALIRLELVRPESGLKAEGFVLSLGDAGAGALAGLTKLRSLKLECTQVGPVGAAQLAALTGLTEPSLHDNLILDSGAAALSPLTRLRSINAIHQSILANAQLGRRGLSRCMLSLASPTSLLFPATLVMWDTRRGRGCLMMACTFRATRLYLY